MNVENIKEGLKIAITKGESLQQAMQSFYNAGYPQEEIQQAAALISQEGFTQVSQPVENQQYPTYQETYQPNQNQYSPDQIYNSQPQQQNQQSQNIQKVSSYGEKEEDPRKTMIIVVTSLLVFLGLILGGLFLFREQVISFFESLFG